MKLYCAWYCPFAQRAWMALLYKELAFEYIEVDPYDETDWWLNISRQTAYVPVIIPTNDDGQQAKSIVESARILEYLDDLKPNQHPIFSSTPEQRAEQKYWIDYVGNKIIPYFYRFLKAYRDDQYRRESQAKLLQGLDAFSQALAPNQPFFTGETMSAVDIAFAPFAYRIAVLLKTYRDFQLPTQGEAWQRYHHWYQTMLQTPVFKATSLDHADYQQRLIDFYLPYSQGEGQKDVEIVS